MRELQVSRYAVLNEIKELDPEADHERIVHLTSCYEFPFDITRALEFALFRTYCVPSISGLLARTGEFEARPQKRYDDTDIIISEMMEQGYSSARGREALERMNQMHGRFKIVNEDFLYVLSTFVFEPVRWVDRYGWRPMCGQERLAMFHFWREVGQRMGIEDIPDEYGVFDTFNRVYERDNYRYSDTNAPYRRGDRRPVCGLVPGAGTAPRAGLDPRHAGRRSDRGIRVQAAIAVHAVDRALICGAARTARRLDAAPLSAALAQRKCAGRLIRMATRWASSGRPMRNDRRRGTFMNVLH